MSLLKYLPEYEAYYGEKMRPKAVHFAKQLDAIGQKFEEKGRDDAAKGLPAACDESFQAWGKKVFYDDPETAESLSELMKMCYMDGYQEGGTA